MRSEFCNWFEKRHGKNPHHFTEDYADYTYLKHETGKAWQHQQYKIDELQKRVDATKQLIEDLNKCYQQDHQNKFEYWRGFADSAGILGKRLEQALKGESNG